MTRVLLSVHHPSRNPYIGQLADEIDALGQVYYFSWARALFGRFDVFHVHWAESLYTSGGRASRFLKRLLVRAFLLRLRILRRPVVTTMHNRGLHDDLAPADLRIYDLLQRSVTLRIFMNPDGSEQWPLTAVIPHGDYRVHLGFPYSPPVDSGTTVLLQCGQLRPYKNISELVTAFGETDDEHLRLLIAGSARPKSYAAELQELAQGDPRIAIEEGFLDEPVLAETIASSDLVVLPYPDPYNSGALFMVLSVGRPVLIRSTPETRRLAAEFGEEWVLTFEGGLTGSTLEEAARSVRGHTYSTWPDMSGRAWPEIGRAHMAAYEKALNRLRPARARRGPAS
ncbi:hypothetical protein B7R22_02850 [Subtercola boreus]|uniref:Glycosyl transferase n=1 Tax=Subtercola boreus TaxID=120213 RepID=A0A3E0W392_9MICO|nr:glycosyltransferase [Subtercola boreus]RFA16441.1 hypothetical protein B7R22_02850 [Subtercola boreus]